MASISTPRAGACRIALVALCLINLPAKASSIAVKRGQTTVDPAILPLVCLEVATKGGVLPLDGFVFENLDDHTITTLWVAGRIEDSHPDILTAMAPGPLSLSLPILRLRPGRYAINSVLFLTGGFSDFTMDLSAAGYWFEVKPGCVNYLGGLEIAAEWSSIRRFYQEHGRLAHDVAKMNIETMTFIRDTVQRDVKWACSVDPGMAALPLTVSRVHKN